MHGPRYAGIEIVVLTVSCISINFLRPPVYRVYNL